MSSFNNYKEYPFTIGDTLFTFATDRPTINPSTDYSKQTVSFHTHRYCEIFFVLHGQIKVYTESTSYELSEGDCIYIPAGCRHTSEYLEDSQRFALPFFYSKQKTENTAKKYFDTFESLFDDHIRIFWQFIGAEAFKRFAYYYYSSYTDKDELITTCCREIILLLKASVSSDSIPTPMYELSDTDNYRNYVISNFFGTSYKNGTLTQLSELLHLSPQQTQRLIKNLYGETFRDHLIHLKMKQAGTLLLNTTHPAAKIAEEVGYAYTHSFYEAFKKYYNRTPEQYRQEHC